MLDADYYIRKLEASDSVQSFKVGSQSFLPLKTFLQKQAKQFQQSSIAQTYVAVTGDKTIIGFVTLTCSEIDLQHGYDLSDCSHANNYEFLPAVKIARLAVDNRYRSSGIGSTLVDYAIALIRDKIALLPLSRGTLAGHLRIKRTVIDNTWQTKKLDNLLSLLLLFVVICCRLLVLTDL